MSLVGYVLFRHSEQKAAERKRRRRAQSEAEWAMIRYLVNRHKEKKAAKKADEEARERGFRNRYHENWVLIEAEAMNEEFDREPEPEADFSHVVEVATALLAGGETTADVAAYIAYQTGIPQKEAKAILLGIKGELAVKAELLTTSGLLTTFLENAMHDVSSRAEANRAWVRNKIAERGWTEEIEKEAELVAELRTGMEECEGPNEMKTWVWRCMSNTYQDLEGREGWE